MSTGWGESVAGVTLGWVEPVEFKNCYGGREGIQNGIVHTRQPSVPLKCIAVNPLFPVKYIGQLSRSPLHLSGGPVYQDSGKCMRW